MPNTKIDQLVENFFNPKPVAKEQQFSINELLFLIEEVQNNFKNTKTLTEQEGGERFSVSIPLPKLVPTEAWGNPENQSRKDVDRIFASITRQGGVKERIDHVNSFLDPKQAIKKAPGGKVNTVLNMLQIIEALQAALNDYNESSAGFVFEGFMAALTGGKQISGRVGGTLPIEDFITSDGEQVSLKLLSPKTGIHGSFTNLIDYLFLRGNAGEPSIKYLVAYKDVEGKNVSKLAIYDFLISRENFVDVMIQSKNESLFGKILNAFKQHVANWEDSPQWRLQMAEILKQTPGYDQRRGMFIKNLDQTGQRIETEVEDEEDEVGKPGYEQRVKGGFLMNFKNDIKQAGTEFGRSGGDALSFDDWWKQNVTPEVLDQLGKQNLSDKTKKNFVKDMKALFDDAANKAKPLNESYSYFGTFDAREKTLLLEAKGSSGEGGAQWSISGPNLLSMEQLAQTRFYGEINLSQTNINELAKIYIDKIGKDMMKLLQTTKEFTENIGRYFSTDDRAEAMNANKTAIAQGGQIITSLAADPTATSE
jgi:hypothetical protein